MVASSLWIANGRRLLLLPWRAIVTLRLAGACCYVQLGILSEKWSTRGMSVCVYVCVCVSARTHVAICVHAALFVCYVAAHACRISRGFEELARAAATVNCALSCGVAPVRIGGESLGGTYSLASSRAVEDSLIVFKVRGPLACVTPCSFW